jgi:hypothetical protein
MLEIRRREFISNRIRALAHELVALQPDIIVTIGTMPTVAVQRETRTIPMFLRA